MEGQGGVLFLRTKISALIDKLELGHTFEEPIEDELYTIYEQIEDAQPERWQEDCVGLVEIISEFSGVVDTCLQRVECLKESIEDLKERIKTLEEDAKKMNRNKHSLVVGQVAFDVERFVVSHVLNGLIGPEPVYINTIEDLESVIDADEDYDDVLSAEETQVAGERWKELKEKLHWNSKHFRYIKTLKYYHVESAHPVIDPTMAEAALEVIPEVDKETFEELLYIYKGLKRLVPED